MQKEASARIKINKLLELAGWRLIGDDHGPANVVLENHVKMTKSSLDAYGDDFEKTVDGFVDFLLLDSHTFPLVVLEAKSEDKDPLVGKEQARKYALSEHARFVILSNGNLHYFWDLEQGNPTVITRFPRQESVGERTSYKPNADGLAGEQVGADYIAVTEYPDYLRDPRWTDPKLKGDLIKERELMFLRPYQSQAIAALQASARRGNNRFLFEMATGTGKTLTCAAVIKLFLRTVNATRVLFLVDRLELEEQAKAHLIKWLCTDYKCVVYKEHRDNWNSAEVVVSTVQSLTSDEKYRQIFSPTDFDLVISDEAHRSINGNARALFEYFIGSKLGLTATPRDYLKNIDPNQLSKDDPRAWERRQLLDTYRTFGCGTGEPTFRYSLLDGVRDGYLINPIVVDARTEITTQLLSDEGYAAMVPKDDGDDMEETFYQKDFEKRFFSERTNRVFCEAFLDNALTDPITGEIGKSVVFCVSQKHASKITQILNLLAEERWPGKYASDFAVQVTSSVPGSQQFAMSFADRKNNLNGQTNWCDGYESSKTRVCVTVGMMTTGYDCQDLLNLCLMRPIFSPTDFIQIKGRGTRPWKFTLSDGSRTPVVRTKERFKLFDFFANCEYFEQKYNYDEILKLPRISMSKAPPGESVFVESSTSDVTVSIPDPLKQLTQTPVGLKGMKIDWKLFERARDSIRADAEIERAMGDDRLDLAATLARDHFENRPELYLTLDRLKEATNLDRRLTWREVLERMFGRIDHFRTKDELLDDEYANFIAVTPDKPNALQAAAIRNFMKAYITDPEIRSVIESKEYGRLVTNPKVNMKDLEDLNGYLAAIPEYVKDYVALNTYM